MSQPTALALQNVDRMHTSDAPAPAHRTRISASLAAAVATALGAAQGPAQPIAAVSMFALFSGTLATGAEAMSDALAAQTSFNIPAQPLGLALKQLADQAGIQILFEEQVVHGFESPAVRAKQSAAQALDTLLSNTGLEYTARGETVAVRRKNAVHTPSLSGDNRPRPEQWAAAGEEKKSLWQRFRLAEVEQGRAATESQGGGSSSQAGDQRLEVEEVVVTAQKRIERLRDVPVPVTALTAERLVENNQLRLQDYYTSIPGLGYQPGGRGEPTISIRGVTAEYGANPSVGIVIDDVPYGASTGLGGGYTAPDIDPSDLTRIEVLRGPQGTLYGASSLGGLLKFVTVDPSMDRMSGRVQGGVSSVRNGDQLGYNARGSINVPLGDELAVRASGFTRRDPGYIDNIQANEDGVNWGEAQGGRVSAVWRPTDDVSLKLGALIQRNEKHGLTYMDTAAGFSDLQQARLPETGWFERKTQFYNANLTAKLGGADVTSLTGYSIDQLDSLLDFSYAVPNWAVPDHRKNTKFTQEIRVSSALGPHVEWLVGGFYTHEQTPAEQDVVVFDPVAGQIGSALFLIPFEMTFSERAAFADLTFHLTDRFDVQVGGRESRIRQHYTQSILDPVTLTGSFQDGRSKANAFTYMLTPRLKISPDLMVYARLASGYRAGGPNPNAALSGVPSEYDPDETVNYEVGVKGDFLDHALSIDASVYHINWTDLQIIVNAPGGGFQYTANASRAKSEGVELSVESRPLAGLTLAAWAVWNNAQLTEDFPSNTYGIRALSGDPLPNSVEWSGHLSVDQDFPLGANMTGFVGGMLSYVGERFGQYRASSSAPQLVYPSYTQTDLRAGVKWDDWLVNAFVTNLTDKRAVLAADAVHITAVVPNQPRTIGLSVSRSF